MGVKEIWRAWVNQPSIYDDHHDLHGRRGIVIDKGDPRFVTIYFAEGPLVSTKISRRALSKTGGK